ncbi:hypothetical protein AB1Y20_008915 [Prymnesium parvum]|uniref:Uncharacterized protein n=1 Tax=Prymnesium parvum TaxID=97485 RepID=A0AB34K0M4_PRYPA
MPPPPPPHRRPSFSFVSRRRADFSPLATAASPRRKPQAALALSRWACSQLRLLGSAAWRAASRLSRRTRAAAAALRRELAEGRTRASLACRAAALCALPAALAALWLLLLLLADAWATRPINYDRTTSANASASVFLPSNDTIPFLDCESCEACAPCADCYDAPSEIYDNQYDRCAASSGACGYPFGALRECTRRCAPFLAASRGRARLACFPAHAAAAFCAYRDASFPLARAADPFRRAPPSVYLPRDYSPAHAYPLLLLLGSRCANERLRDWGLRSLRHAFGFILLAPEPPPSADPNASRLDAAYVWSLVGELRASRRIAELIVAADASAAPLAAALLCKPAAPLFGAVLFSPRAPACVPSAAAHVLLVDDTPRLPAALDAYAAAAGCEAGCPRAVESLALLPRPRGLARLAAAREEESVHWAYERCASRGSAQVFALRPTHRPPQWAEPTARGEHFALQQRILHALWAQRARRPPPPAPPPPPRAAGAAACAARLDARASLDALLAALLPLLLAAAACAAAAARARAAAASPRALCAGLRGALLGAAAWRRTAARVRQLQRRLVQQLQAEYSKPGLVPPRAAFGWEEEQLLAFYEGGADEATGEARALLSAEASERAHPSCAVEGERIERAGGEPSAASSDEREGRGVRPPSSSEGREWWEARPPSSDARPRGAVSPTPSFEQAGGGAGPPSSSEGREEGEVGPPSSEGKEWWEAGPPSSDARQRGAVSPTPSLEQEGGEVGPPSSSEVRQRGAVSPASSLEQEGGEVGPPSSEGKEWWEAGPPSSDARQRGAVSPTPSLEQEGGEVGPPSSSEGRERGAVSPASSLEQEGGEVGPPSSSDARQRGAVSPPSSSDVAEGEEVGPLSSDEREWRQGDPLVWRQADPLVASPSEYSEVGSAASASAMVRTHSEPPAGAAPHPHGATAVRIVDGADGHAASHRHVRCSAAGGRLSALRASRGGAAEETAPSSICCARRADTAMSAAAAAPDVAAVAVKKSIINMSLVYELAIPIKGKGKLYLQRLRRDHPSIPTSEPDSDSSKSYSGSWDRGKFRVRVRSHRSLSPR